MNPNPFPQDICAIEFRPEDKPYVIREARTLRELDEVHRITHDSIVEAGYMAPQRGGRIISYPALDPSPLTTILVAIADGRIVGTNSITADGPLGLHTDLYFPRETDAARREGLRLVSSFRIATDPAWPGQNGSALVLDIVKWTAFVAIHKYGFETMLCSFNPKHELVYRRMLHARTIALIEDLGHGDIQAGAVMMRIDRDAVLRKLGRDLERMEAQYLRTRGDALGLASALGSPPVSGPIVLSAGEHAPPTAAWRPESTATAIDSEPA